MNTVIIKSENQKLRESIPLTDRELLVYLRANHLPHEVANGELWIPYESLKKAVSNI